jgi:acyl-CoA synthetase (NDP forming)
MVSEIRGVARLRGHRGRPAGDEGALRDVLLRIAALLEAHPEIREMDVNPLIVRPQGIVAVDVRIRLDAPVMQRVSRRVRY